MNTTMTLRELLNKHKPEWAGILSGYKSLNEAKAHGKISEDLSTEIACYVLSVAKLVKAGE